MNHHSREGFLGAVGKIDGTGIVLKHKPGGIYNGDFFYQKRGLYTGLMCGMQFRLTIRLYPRPLAQFSA